MQRYIRIVVNFTKCLNKIGILVMVIHCDLRKMIWSENVSKTRMMFFEITRRFKFDKNISLKL